MKEYPKIHSVFNRDEKTHKFIEGEWALPEFEYLQDNEWEWTEKIDGTNIRVGWDNGGIEIGGRTDNAQIPTFLLGRLNELFTVGKLTELYPDTPMTFYGEGYGARIQKGGGNYIPDGVDFILFDVLIDGWWLKREGIVNVALTLGIEVVPLIFKGTTHLAVSAVGRGLGSTFGDFKAEGLVGKTPIGLQSRNGHRIMTKLKGKDFTR